MEIDEPQEGSESASLSKEANGQGSRPYLLTHSLSLSLPFISLSFPSFLQIYQKTHHEPLAYHRKQRFLDSSKTLSRWTGAGAGDS